MMTVSIMVNRNFSRTYDDLELEQKNDQCRTSYLGTTILYSYLDTTILYLISCSYIYYLLISTQKATDTYYIYLTAEYLSGCT